MLKQSCAADILPHSIEFSGVSYLLKLLYNELDYLILCSKSHFSPIFAFVLQLFGVNSGSPEYNEISALFRKTLQHRSIDSLHRVENGAQVCQTVMLLRSYDLMLILMIV
jgi:hypothetical protein